MNISRVKVECFKKLFEHYKTKKYETEARFGFFNGKNFTPEITKEQYERLIYFFDKRSKFYTKKITNDVITIYNDGERKIENEDGVLCQTKQKYDLFEVSEYGLRVSFSKETPMVCSTINFSDECYSNKRQRSSFYSDEAKIKFDIDCYPDKFTVEVESVGCNYETFYQNIILIIQIIQDSEIIISSLETKKVLADYFKTSHKKKFIGVQPETLGNEKIQKGISYALTKKLDGLRGLLTNFEGNLYMISSNLTVKKLPYSCDITEKFILDGEYFRGDYHIFDICTGTGNLEQRMIQIKNIYDNIKILSHSKLWIKKYHFGDFYCSFKKLCNEMNINYDGIILVKSDFEYSKSCPLKWKPLDKTTIDFQIYKNDIDVTLYVSSGDDLEEFGKSRLESFKDFENNEIVESFYNGTEFVGLKKRPDKIKPNYVTVAHDNWNSIKHPFDIEQFKDFQSRKISSLFNMRRYHNWLKRTYIQRYSKQNVLDLACGKGGDFAKYIDANNKYIEAYDINSDSLKEANRRKDHYLVKSETKNVSIKTGKKDLNSGTLNCNIKFDLIVCNFAFHYFYKSIDIFISNILSNSKSGSIIMLTFFDGKKIKNEINDEFSIKKIGNNEVEVYIKDSVLNNPEKENIVDVDHVISSFKEYGINLLENKNFSELYHDWTSLHPSNTLDHNEKKLSFLNNVLIFKVGS